jgi:anti-anti-sigma factor
MPDLDARYLEVNLEKGVLVLTVLHSRVEGEEVAHAIKEEMTAAVSESGATKVVIDLKNTRYVSSIVFWPLLSLRRQLQERGGQLLICGLTGIVRDVFTMTKMVNSGGAANAPFEMEPDRAAAVARLSAGA